MHTKLVSLFIALFLCLPLFAQKESVPRIDSEGVYLIPDEMPKFPGGMQAMMKYLATNVKYPFRSGDYPVRSDGRWNTGTGKGSERS